MKNHSVEPQLRKKIQESLAIQIPLAFLHLLQDSCDLALDPIHASISIIDADISSLHSFILDRVLTLEEVLKKDEQDRYAMVQEILKSRGILLEKFHTIYGYSAELNIFTFALDEIYHLRQMEEQDVEDLDYHQFYHDCYDFILQAKDPLQKDQRIRQILKNLPLRMTKDRFFDYIKESILQIDSFPTEASASHFITMLRQQFLPSSFSPYGSFFPDAANALQGYVKKDLAALSLDELEQLAEETDVLGDTLSSLINYLSLLYKAMNDLLIFLALDGIDLDFLLEQHVAYRDLYQTASMMLQESTSSEEKEAYMDTLMHLFNTHIEDKLSRYETISDELLPLYQKWNENHADYELSRLMQTENLIRMYLDMELIDELSYDGSTDSPPASQPFIRTQAERFIDFVKSSIADMPTIYRKARMQSLLGLLPAIWDEDRCIEYMETVLESSSKPEIKAIAVSRIGYIMEQSGFWHNHHDHDHPHDHDCQCGHDHHHHDHDCGCDHDHHH